MLYPDDINEYVKLDRIDINPDVMQMLTLLDMEKDWAKMRGQIASIERRTEELKKQVFAELLTFEWEGKFGLKMDDRYFLTDGRRLLEAPIYDELVIEPSCVLAKFGEESIVLYEDGIRVDIHILCDKILSTNVVSKYIIKKKDKYGLYDSEKREYIVPLEMDSIEEHSEYFLLHKDSKVGYVDHRFTILPVYNKIRFCRTYGYVGFFKGEEPGFIDSDGQWTNDINEASLWTMNDNY